MNINNNYLTITAAAIIISFSYLMFPTLILPGEAIYEMASSFFYTAYYSDDLIRSFLHTDIGYLLWLPMIIFIIFARWFGFTHYIFDITQVVSTLLLVFYVTFFCSASYKTLIYSNLIRAILSVYIGILIIFRSMELVIFMDATYVGYIFLLLMIFYDEKLLSNTKLVLYILLSILIICSKATFIVFLPIYLASCIIFYRKKNQKLLIYSIFSLLATLINFANLFKISQNTSDLNLYNVIFNAIIYFISGFASRTGIYQIGKSIGYEKIFLIATLIIITLSLILCYKKNYRVFLFVLAAYFTSFFSLILLFGNSTTKTWYPLLENFQLSLIDTPDVRHFLFLNIAIILSISTLIFALIKNKQVRITIFFLFLLIYGYSNYSRNGFLVEQFKVPPQQWRFGQWSILHKFLNEDGYLITGYPETIFFSSGKYNNKTELKDRIQPLNNVGIWDSKFDQSFNVKESSQYKINVNDDLRGIIVFPRTQVPAPNNLYLSTKSVIIQEFTSQNNYLNGLSINVGVAPQNENISLLLSILDSSDKIIYQENLLLKHHRIMSYLGFHTEVDKKIFFKFAAIDKSRNKKYKLKVEVINSHNNSFYFPTRISFDKNSKLFENSKKLNNVELQFIMFYTPPILRGIDNSGKIIATGTLITPEENTYKYYSFNNSVTTGISKIDFVDINGENFTSPSRIMLFGRKNKLND